MRKIIIAVFCMLLIFSTVVSAQSSELTVLAKVKSVETILYGAEQTGSLLDRVNKLEKDIYGTESKDAIMAKLDRIYTYVTDASVQPSFLIKLNAVEWTLTHRVSSEPIKARIENLEKLILGISEVGSFDQRLTKLLNLAYSGGMVSSSSATINKDTLIKIKLVSPLSSKTSRVGDTVVYEVAEDVYAGSVLVIPTGARGTGKVTKVQQARNFGRDAKLDISFDNIQVIDGTIIQTLMGDKAKEETKSLAKAAGATVAGLVVLGPIGVIGGAFVHGQDVEIPVGAQVYIQTKDDVDIFGLTVN